MTSNREHPHNGRNVAGQPSDFANRLTVLMKQWAELLPWDLQQRFKDEFRSFGAEHDEILDTIRTDVRFKARRPRPPGRREIH